MSSPNPSSISPAVEEKESEGDTSKSSSSSQQKPNKQIQQNEQCSSSSRDVTSNSSISSTNYDYLKALQYSKPTSDSDESNDGFPKYSQKRSDTLPNSYFSTLSYGIKNPEISLDSYSSDEDSKSRHKIFGKGKGLLKKTVFKTGKRKSGDNRLKDSILSNYAEMCYKCKLCKVSPCYNASVESFIFHMKNQHSEIYKEMLLKPVTNGNCHQEEVIKHIDGSSSDDTSCNYTGRITSEHLLKYSKLWQNSPKSSATDPKTTEEPKITPSSSSSKEPTAVPPQIQKVTEEFLKSCDNLSLPGNQTSSTNILSGIPQSKPCSLSPNTAKKSPSSNSPSKLEQNGWKCDLPPSFTPEFGRYTKLVREGGNIVYFCQVCNWKCQVKAAFSVHCNGQQHVNKARLADNNNFDKCKQKSEPNNVKAAIRKAIDYRDNLNKQQTTTSSNNSNSNNSQPVKLPIINVPKVPAFNKTAPTESESTKQFVKQTEVNDKHNDTEKSETRNKRKRPFPVRRTSADGDEWVDSESDDEVETKRTRPDTLIEPIPKKVINPFISHYPSMIPMEDYFSRYSASKLPNLTSGFETEDKSNKYHIEDRDKDVSLNLPMFPTGSTGLLPESRDDNLDIQYRCTFCNVYCAGPSDYKDHFRTEHDIDTPDLTMADGKGSQNNEWWKMMKIKETLSDLLVSSPKGNVSRDLLLHKVSLTLNMPEVVRWGPSCNKAVREEFPNSLAQRKGKFKKTYFFGVALMEQVQEQEELSDGDMNYQPLRDMSNDLERILEHLPSMVKWTGNQVAGIPRDDVLELLAQKIDEREVIHWGVQCNRAVRMLFPDVQMKRKGKYKTVFYGVEFSNPSDKQMIMRTSKLLDNDKDEYLPVSFRDEDIKQSQYTVTNPLLSYNPIAAQHNELAMQYQSQLFNMWRFMSPFHHYPLQPGLGMMNMGNNSSITKGSNSACSSRENESPRNGYDSPRNGCESPRNGYESPILSVGSKSDLDQFMGGNSKSPIEDTGQTATNCGVEERKDRDVNILSSPLPVVTS